MCEKLGTSQNETYYLCRCHASIEPVMIAVEDHKEELTYSSLGCRCKKCHQWMAVALSDGRISKTEADSWGLLIPGGD